MTQPKCGNCAPPPILCFHQLETRAENTKYSICPQLSSLFSDLVYLTPPPLEGSSEGGAQLPPLGKVILTLKKPKPEIDINLDVCINLDLIS